MDKETILKKVEEIFRKELKNQMINLHFTTTAKEVPGWDSITHVLLVVAVERSFKKRFSSKEIQSWKNIGEMIESLMKE